MVETKLYRTSTILILPCEIDVISDKKQDTQIFLSKFSFNKGLSYNRQWGSSRLIIGKYRIYLYLINK